MGFTIAGAESSAPRDTGPVEPWLHLYDAAYFRLQLLGFTGTGKTTLIGELADYIRAERGQRTLLYNIDRGSPDSIREYLTNNIIINVDRGDRDPFIFADRAVQGLMPINGQWKPIPPELNIGLVAFDSATGISEEQLHAMQESTATNSPIGQAGYSFNIRDEVYGDVLKVGTVDGTHYGISQSRIAAMIWKSQALPYNLIWTANLRHNGKDSIRPNQPSIRATKLGADLGGRALIEVSPRWFQYTWTLEKVSVATGMTRRVLHLESYIDQASGLEVVGNPRIPLRGDDMPPTVIEPASLVRAFSVLGKRHLSANEDIVKRLGVTQEDLDIRKRLGL